MRVLLTQGTPLPHRIRRGQAMTLLLVRDLLEDLLGDHPRTLQDNQEEEDLRVSRRLEDHLVLHLRDRHRHHLLRLRLPTLHQVLQGSLPSL